MPYIMGDRKVLPPCPPELTPLPQSTQERPCIASHLITKQDPEFYSNMHIGDCEPPWKGWEMDKLHNEELLIRTTHNRDPPESSWKYLDHFMPIRRRGLKEASEVWSSIAKQTLAQAGLEEGCTSIIMDPIALPQLFDAQACLRQLSPVDVDTEDHQSRLCGFFVLPEEWTTTRFRIDATSPGVYINRWWDRLVVSLLGDVQATDVPVIKAGIEDFSVQIRMRNQWSIAVWGNNDPEITQAWSNLGASVIDKMTAETAQDGRHRYAFASWTPRDSHSGEQATLQLLNADPWSHFVN